MQVVPRPLSRVQVLLNCSMLWLLSIVQKIFAKYIFSQKAFKCLVLLVLELFALWFMHTCYCVCVLCSVLCMLLWVAVAHFK